ncbi:MAG: sigma-54 interaction domain-containing protein [Terriglobia bacterium]
MSYLASVNPIAVFQRPAVPPDAIIFGRSAALESVRRLVEKIKASNVTVLIQGESGTGKEVLARLLHDRSPWAEGPLVKISCPSIPVTLLESELFGYEKGAFTGAYGSKRGRVEMANRGTLLLDEIGEIDLSVQAKLLQLLQDGQFSRIGAQVDKRVELRVICATNRDLEKEVEAGNFRRDLFYRLNVVALHLPPLRDRREDIPSLVDYFLNAHSAAHNLKFELLSPWVTKLLQTYDWPGNIRQLENLLKRYVLLGSEEAIAGDLLGGAPDGLDMETIMEGPGVLKKASKKAALEAERKVILSALHTHHWNCKNAARSLGISYRSMFYKMRQVGLPLRNGNGRSMDLQEASISSGNGSGVEEVASALWTGSPEKS